MTEFKLLLIKAEGTPKWSTVLYPYRRLAVRAGEAIIAKGDAKVVIVYRGDIPKQVLIYRPQTYVHLERI